MIRSRFYALLFVACVSALLFAACKDKSASPSPGAPAEVRRWPPDTMAISILGGGRLQVRAAWASQNVSADGSEPVTFEVVPVIRPTRTRPRIPMSETPPDTTPSNALRTLLNQSPGTGSTEPVLMTKWPPDTTGTGY
jgi:hypothetical protein